MTPLAQGLVYGLAAIGFVVVVVFALVLVGVWLDNHRTKRAAEEWLERAPCEWVMVKSDEWGEVWKEGCRDESPGFMSEPSGWGFNYCPYCGGEIHKVREKGAVKG